MATRTKYATPAPPRGGGRPRTRPAPRASARSPGKAPTPPSANDPAGGDECRVLIVAIGASAGGVDAVSRLLRRLPSDTGMAFVVLQHLDPRRPSLLRDVLAQSTSMPVIDAANGARPQANHVHVMPPGTEMALKGGVFAIAPTETGRRTHRSIDLFLRSLAEEEPGCAIGVVLSGTGADGTEGLRAIRAAGGIALVEDPASAKFPAMPESAVAAGVADRVLGIDELADELVALGRAPYLRSPDASAPLTTGASQDELVAQVLGLVRRHCGSDFSEYKSTTFRRRLARRVLIRRSGTLETYLELLRAEPAEVAALCRDILIHVTEFFRDPTVFAALSRLVIPKILERHAGGDPIRIWVPGCSTGEEPYSIAIDLLEALGERSADVAVQIFGSDLSGEMIDRARAAIYPEVAVRGLGERRLERFFTPVAGGYRVNKAVRNLCVFVKHDLTRDPPFARLDLISCRNVLIYFGALLQRRILPLFHYCLEPDGFLLLGPAETAPVGSLFAVVDKEHRIYTKIGAARPLASPLARARAVEGPRGAAVGPTAVPTRDIERQADNLLLGRYAPPSALVDERMDVVHLRGQTAPFLEIKPGRPDLNLLSLAREGLVPALRAAFKRAREEKVPVRREALQMQGADGIMQVNLVVLPVSGVPGRERHFLVLFERAAERPAPSRKGTRSGRTGRRAEETGRPAAHRRELERLREEAAAAREFLQSLVDERQRMNDEITASNEELVASNEEMQSTNEELEAAKEELQSSNEELSTVNDELQLRNHELARVNSDLQNILDSVDIPIVIVSGDRRVRRFTPGATAIMNLIASDVGRPLGDIRMNVRVDDLDGLISEVLKSLAVKEVEVQDRQGRWLRLQVRPYRTVDDRLDGVVLSLTDIDLLKQAVGDATAAFDQVTAILQTLRVPVVVLDGDLRVRFANPAYAAEYPEDSAVLAGAGWLESAGGLWDQPVVADALARLQTDGGEIALKVELVSGDGSHRTVAVAGGLLRWPRDPRHHVLLTLVDVTEHARLLEQASVARREAERANQAKDVFLAILSHELRAPLHTITLHVDLLLAAAASDAARVQRAAEAIGRAAAAQEKIISDLLDVSAIVAGKILVKRILVELSAVVGASLDTVRDSATEKRITLRDETDCGPARVLGDPTRLQQIVVNLLTNAVKFTPAGGCVTVSAGHDGRRVRLTVSDTGPGISADFLPHVFDRFAQADTSNARVHGGLGLGLAIVRDLARLHGGTVSVASEGPGKGAAFTVELPLVAAEALLGRGAEEETSPWGHDVRALAAALEPSVNDLDGIKVLVVDDDGEAREVLADILVHFGAQVRSVGRAIDVVPAISEFRPDVLMCDIAMPDEDGYSLIRRVRALAPADGGQIPAIAVTALATRSDRKQALAAGFQLHVAKPTPVAVLCAAVRRLHVGGRN